MIKKLVLLVLVLILVPLTYLLYRQMEELRPARDMHLVQEAEHVEQELDPQKIMRQWTPPEKRMGPEVKSDDAANLAKSIAAETPQQEQPAGAAADATDSVDAADSEKSRFTDKELLSPQEEVTELMTALQARSLRQETKPTLDLPQPEQPQTAFPASQPLPKGINSLKELHAVAQNDAVEVQVVGLGDIGSYKYFFIGSPSRLVVDLLGKYDRSIPERDVRDNVFIKDIRTGRHPDKLRIVADLKSAARLRLSVEKPQGNVLLLHLTKQ